MNECCYAVEATYEAKLENAYARLEARQHELDKRDRLVTFLEGEVERFRSDSLNQACTYAFFLGLEQGHEEMERVRDEIKRRAGCVLCGVKFGHSRRLDGEYRCRECVEPIIARALVEVMNRRG